MRLKDKIAIITGAAGGMGQAAAILFAREGAKVALVDLTEEALADTLAQVREGGGEAIGIGADITVAADAIRIGARTREAFGLPTVLFNNAGVDLEGKLPLLNIDEAAFDRTLAVNIKGVWLMMKHIAPLMIEAGGGSIVNTTSISAIRVVSTAGYSASKAGAEALTRVAAVELGKYGIRVNAVSPGATETPMAKHQRAEMQARGLPTDSVIARMGVMGRFAEPVEMAQMALFLASDESSFATGGVFVNDAGWSVMGGLETRA